MPVGSTTVTRASRPSSFDRRLAASVPPTPPPRTTTRAGTICSPGLAHDEADEAVLFIELHHLVPGLADPGGDIRPRALVGREHLENLTDPAVPDRADQAHERAGARHPA